MSAKIQSLNPDTLLAKVTFDSGGSTVNSGSFTQFTIPTGLLPQNELVMDVQNVVVQIDSISAVTAGSLVIDCQLTRSSKSAMARLTDLDILAKRKLMNPGEGTITAAAAGWFEGVFSLDFDGDMIVVAPNIYLGFLTNGLTFGGVSAYISYIPKKMTKEQILAILYG